MRRLIVAFAVGAAVLLVPAANAAPVEKVGVCHWAVDDEQFVHLLIPAKQLDKGKGHARHEEDRFGLTREECQALNEAP